MTARDAAGFFDRYAHDFDAIYAGRRRAYQRATDRLLRHSMFLRYRRTLATCNPVAGATVLDVGCGPGHYGIALAQAGARRVVGIDISGEMVKLAGTKARRANVASRCHFEQADYLTWEPGDTFDFVILMGFMDYVDDARGVVERALEQMRRAAMFSFPVRRGILAWQRRLRYRLKTPLFMYTEEDLDRLFGVREDLDTEISLLARDYFVIVRRQS